jgi:Domain of unknown function (DUF4331)
MKLRTALLRSALAIGIAALAVHPKPIFAASHREAPITALDHKADITDWYAFVSPENGEKVILIMNVDPLLEPSNGPNYFPFDPNVLYQMKIDNNFDGLEDIVFQFQFQSQIQLPNVFTGFVGGLLNIPPITSLSGPGAAGLSEYQTFTVQMLANGHSEDLGVGQSLIAVPTNVGPRTMPNYAALRQQGIYTLSNGIRVFAGTVADPFFIDLGAFFDSLNFRMGAGSGVLPQNIEMDDQNNYAPNALAGFNVNTIVLEIPTQLLTQDGQMHAATDARAVIGTWATTSRKRLPVLGEATDAGGFAQVQRMGNPLINEGIIGTGSKDRFSMDAPVNDAQFANFFLNPLVPTILASLGLPVPPAPRTDLLPLVQYMAPICPGCTAAQAGPVADLLRLNTGIPPTPITQLKRLGFIAGDIAGYPNGRRPQDDVLDISLRALEGILVNATTYGTPLGDGVNMSGSGLTQMFPFEGPAYDGRDSVHEGPGQAGCNTLVNQTCPTN